VGEMVADLKARLSAILPDWVLNFLPDGSAPAFPVSQPALTPSDTRSHGMTVNFGGGITVNAAPGMSEKGVAEQVRRELEKTGASRPGMRDRGGNLFYDWPQDVLE